MSNISEIRVNLSSDQRDLLKAAGLDETAFVRGAFAAAIGEVAEKASKKEKRAAKPDEPKEEAKSESKPEASSKPSGK